MECKVRDNLDFTVDNARIDLTRMECKDIVKLSRYEKKPGIDLTRMECKGSGAQS